MNYDETVARSMLRQMDKDIKTQVISEEEPNHQILPEAPLSTKKQPATTRPRVVIVGAGFGGLKAARGLRNAPVDITVIDRNNHHLFQPLLYQSPPPAFHLPTSARQSAASSGGRQTRV